MRDDDDGIPNVKRPLPDAPTSAPPGSPEKMRVFQERVAKRQWLFHPDDAKPSDGSDYENP